MAPSTRLNQILIKGISQCLIRLVQASNTAHAIEALAEFLKGLPLKWHTVDVFGDGRLGKHLVSHRRPRGFAPFLTRTSFLRRQDARYQGAYGDATVLLVKANRSAGESGLACAIGFAKDSPLNEATMTACIAALIQEALSRIVSFELEVRRQLTLAAQADHEDEVIAVFDVRGRIVEQYPAVARRTLPLSLFQTATAPARRQHPRASRPIVLSSDGRVYDVRVRWVTSDRILDSRYLIVHARTRSAAPIAVVERLRNYGLSPRESQIAGLVFTGHTNQLIAQALFISRDTVKTHCKHIFGKLGISRRTEFLRVMGES